MIVRNTDAQRERVCGQEFPVGRLGNTLDVAANWG